MEVEQALRTLGLLRTTACLTALRLFGLTHLGTFGHEIDGVLAREALDGGNGSIEHPCLSDGVSGNIDDTDFLTLPGVIELDMNLEGTLAAGCQIETERGVVALLSTLESLAAFGVLSQTAEAEVLEADDELFHTSWLSCIHWLLPGPYMTQASPAE